MWKHEAIMRLPCGLAQLSGLCDGVKGSDNPQKLLAELLLLQVERNWSLIRKSRKHTQLGRDPWVDWECAGRIQHVTWPDGSQRRRI